MFSVIRSTSLAPGILLLLGVCCHAQATLATAPQKKVLASENGRYVFGQISEYARHQYMLDTKTGRLWLLVEDKDRRDLLQPVPYILMNGEEAFIPDDDAAVLEDRKSGEKTKTSHVPGEALRLWRAEHQPKPTDSKEPEKPPDPKEPEKK